MKGTVFLGILVVAVVASPARLVRGVEPPQPRVEDSAPADPDRAIALYDAGKYEEALPILEALHLAGRADGPLLYRLYFCRSRAGDAAAARRALEQAAAALEAEHGSAPRLEIAFYLANAYHNLGRGAEARRVAAEAVEKIESKAWPQPERPIERFQLGKLYEDQGRTEDASRSYRAALDGFAREGSSHLGQARWARRYLAYQAFSRADFALAEQEFTELVKLGEVTRTDWIRLAVASAKLAHYGSAADAWRQADKADPAHGDDPRYASALARLAARIGTLPETAPDGRPWARLSKGELEEIMLSQANRVKEARERAAASPGTVDPETLAEFERVSREAKPLFVAAGLEYAMRGLPIRETAFGSGYAPMIFHEEPWELPSGTSP